MHKIQKHLKTPYRHIPNEPNFLRRLEDVLIFPKTSWDIPRLCEKCQDVLRCLQWSEDVFDISSDLKQIDEDVLRHLVIKVSRHLVKMS